ncbi:GNAT family acetyltransferase [Erysipelotrichaceae bacterium MTC7]|nr:GNAT family acetyltransferase [Erysipelotrichaceae bacterium MTC7]
MNRFNLSYRYATREDADKILYFIRELAVYEKMLDEVVATPQDIVYWLFEKKTAEVIFAVVEGKEVGFALFFHNFSTFVGRAGLYLEDLFVLEAYRGQGIGKYLFQQLATIALDRGCGRMEWCCLNWNQPSIDFYHSLGAKAMDTWTTYRLTTSELETLVKED